MLTTLYMYTYHTETYIPQVGTYTFTIIVRVSVYAFMYNNILHTRL